MLNIISINKIFNKNTPDENKVLNDFSLKLEDGEFVTVIGGNGAGKSTLFNIISGAFYPDSGKIILDGQDITFIKEHKKAEFTGRIFQDPLKGTAPNLTVEENLSMAYMRSTKKHMLTWLSKKERNELKERISHLGLGLENRMNTKIGLLSGGQRQAVTLIMATLVKPKLLLLDEHTAALDPVSAERVLDLTKSIVASQKITTLMITHNISSALQLGTRTIMLDRGRVAVDISGNERENMSVETLLEKFSKTQNRKYEI
jgi:putative ABC transport system ATP-binding protein